MYSKNNLGLIAILSILLWGSCANQGETTKEIAHFSRKNIINVTNRITDIDTDILLGNSLLYIVDDILIVMEIKPSSDKGIHLFSKKDFKYITSTGKLGHGPGEIIRYGRIGIDAENRNFWVPDHGKQMLMKFPLDSVLNNSEFKPTYSLSLSNELFIERFNFLNDSVVLGKAVQVLSSNSYQMVMAKLNTKTNSIENYGYEHPDATGKKSNSYFVLSKEGNFYVNGHVYCDLVTICDLQGNLKYNVLGPDGLENKEFRKTYFTGIDLIGELIVAAYIGADGTIINEHQRLEGNLPSTLLILNKDGDYIATLNTSYKFSSFCIDEENKRVIAYYMDRPNPLGYFEIELDKLKL
jgi:hypothetical protein